jgi:hypothetical protein
MKLSTDYILGAKSVPQEVLADYRPANPDEYSDIQKCHFRIQQKWMKLIQSALIIEF